ncbi:helix-turn-helix domain-containing protein, partial [Streptomyces sp. NPDC005070]
WERAREAGRSTALPEAVGTGSASNPAHTLLAHHRDADRSEFLQHLYTAAGRPSLRQLAEESGHPRSTVHRAVQGQSLAGGKDIASTLLAYLPPIGHQDWVHEAERLFGDSSSIPAETSVPWLFKVKEDDTAGQAEDAIAVFRHTLRGLRNLVVHGDVEINPWFAAQVMELYAVLEEAIATGTAVAGPGEPAPPDRRTGIGGDGAPEQTAGGASADQNSVSLQAAVEDLRREVREAQKRLPERPVFTNEVATPRTAKAPTSEEKR